MKKFLPLGCALLLLTCSCEKDTINVCSVDPIEDLSWLQSRIQLLEQSSLENYSYVQQAELLQETVFIFDNCCPFCNTIVPVYNCQGEVICHLGDCNGLEDQIKNRKLIWQAQDFECNL
jgi:hypothetical protein